MAGGHAQSRHAPRDRLEGSCVVVEGPALSPEDDRIETGFLGVLPHPVRSEALLRYSLAEAGPVDLAIYDVAGRRVRTLVSTAQIAGTHAVRWDTKDDQGRDLTSGVYLYVLEARGTQVEGRITLVR